MAPSQTQPPAPKNVLLLTGGVYHPFQACAEIAKGFLESSGRYRVTVTEDLSILAQGLSAYDALMVYTCGRELTAAQESGLEQFVGSGGALVGVHSAAASFKDSARFAMLLGCQFDYHHRDHQNVRVKIADPAHQVTLRLGGFDIVEELYLLKNVRPDVRVLATADWQGKPTPIFYTREEGNGRVFFTSLGHSEVQFNHPQFRKSLLHGLDWACKVSPRPGPVRCAMLGYGPSYDMGRTHSEHINHTPGMKAVAACDIDPARTAAALREFPDFRTYATCDEMLRDDGIDLVVVILPHNLHAEYAIRCLRAGKHVITEKPFCLTIQEADAMIAASEQAGRMLTVYHNRRFDGDYVTIQRLIREGAIGEVFEIACGFSGYQRPGDRWRSDKAISGGNMYDWGAHFTDWVLGLMPGKIASVNGFFHRKVWNHATNEDHTQAIIRFADGAMADIAFSSISAAPRPRWRILGTRGAILDDGTVDKGGKLITYRDGSLVTSHVTWSQTRWQEYYAGIADHLLCGDELPVKPREARRVIGVIESAERSSKSGQPEIFPGQ